MMQRDSFFQPFLVIKVEQVGGVASRAVTRRGSCERSGPQVIDVRGVSSIG